MWLTRIISVLAPFFFVAALNPQTLPRSIHLRAKDGVDISGLVYEAKQPKAVVLLFHQAGSSKAGLKLPVEQISLSSDLEHKGTFTCDWKAARGTRSDSQLIIAACATAYAGAIVELKYREGRTSLPEILETLPTDTNNIKEHRNAAIEWGIAHSHRDTNQFTKAGYDLASG